MHVLNGAEIDTVGGGFIMVAAEAFLVAYGVAEIGYEFYQGFEQGLVDGAAGR